MKKNICNIIVLLSAHALLVNCGQFGIDEGKKFSKLSQTSILSQDMDDTLLDRGQETFENEDTGLAFGDNSDNGVTGNQPAPVIEYIEPVQKHIEEVEKNKKTPVVVTPQPPKEQKLDLVRVDTNKMISFHRMCSDRYIREDNLEPAFLATTLRLVVTQEGRKVCEITNTVSLQNQISAASQSENKMDLSSCHGLDFTKNVALKLYNQMGQNILFGGSKPKIFWADNDSSTSHDLGPGNVRRENLSSDPAIYDKCQRRESPLFVDLRSKKSQRQGFEFSSPEEGVLFDILGLNSDPGPYVKKQISWFTNAAMGMLVLPRRDGRVLGVNELFGNNTLGPDNEFAENGFLALLKHDKNNDSTIDKKDAVFRQLKIWLDSNKDGVAESFEMMSLQQVGIQSIDLEYDKKYSEEDQHGNMIKFKSVVKMNDGTYHLIYDVWFAIYN